MRCERCKSRPATVNYSYQINGEGGQMALCDQCLAEIQAEWQQPEWEQSGPFGNSFGSGFGNSFPNGLPGFGDLASHFAMPEFPSISPQPIHVYQPGGGQCQHCGTTYQNFRQDSLFGCPYCYEAFSSKLEREVFPRTQRGRRYVGRAYAAAPGGAEVGTPAGEAAQKAQTAAAAEQNTKVGDTALDTGSNEAVARGTPTVFTVEEYKKLGEARLQELRTEAIAAENYEAAARIRDALKQLKEEA